MSADYTMIVLSKVQFPKDEIFDLVDLYGKIITGQYKPKSYIEHLIEASYLTLPWTMHKDIDWWDSVEIPDLFRDGSSGYYSAMVRSNDSMMNLFQFIQNQEWVQSSVFIEDNDCGSMMFIHRLVISEFDPHGDSHWKMISRIEPAAYDDPVWWDVDDRIGRTRYTMYDSIAEKFGINTIQMIRAMRATQAGKLGILKHPDDELGRYTNDINFAQSVQPNISSTYYASE